MPTIGKEMGRTGPPAAPLLLRPLQRHLGDEEVRGAPQMLQPLFPM